MILLQFSTFQCPKCYSVISGTIISKGGIEKDLMEFKHAFHEGDTCEDEGRVIKLVPVQDFMVSVFHD